MKRGRPRLLLTDEQREAIAADPRTYIKISLDYGISDSYVQKIKREAKDVYGPKQGR